MVTAGIDVGSTSAKAVLYDGQLKGYAIRPTGWSPRQAGEEVLAEVLDQIGINRRDVAYIVGKNAGLRRALEAELGVEVLVPAEPRITGALGAAIIGWEKSNNVSRNF